MRITYQIIKGFNLQRVPTIVLSIDNNKYYFNIPDSFQRYYREHKIKLVKGSSYFFTQITPSHILGIIGLLLTIYENKMSEGVKCYGPVGTIDFFDYLRYIYSWKYLTIGAYDLCCSKEEEKEKDNDKDKDKDKKKKKKRKMLGIHDEKLRIKLIETFNFQMNYEKFEDLLIEEKEQNKGNINDPADYITNQGTFKDDNIEIIPIEINPANVDILKGDHDDRKPTICYICKPNRPAGKVKNEKLSGLDIPKQLIGKLLSQGSLEVNGKMYYAEDIKEPDFPSPVLIIIDCPSLEHMELLIKNPRIGKLLMEEHAKQEIDIKSVVHIVPKMVLTNKAYQEWLNSFPKSCKHVFTTPNLVEKDSPISSQFIEYLHMQANNMLNVYFPEYLPKIRNAVDESIGYDYLEEMVGISKKDNNTHMMMSRNYDEFILHPPNKNGKLYYSPNLEKSLYERYNPKNNVEFMNRYNHLMKQTAEIGDSSMICEPSSSSGSKSEGGKDSNSSSSITTIPSQIPIATTTIDNSKPNPDPNPNHLPTDTQILSLFTNLNPHLIFLGTGSMWPSTYRNVTSIYLCLDVKKTNFGVLFDAGEGVYFQLLHHYGMNHMKKFLLGLRIVFISHIHGDHHLGLYDILYEREKVYKEELKKGNIEPVYVIIPAIMASWIETMSRIFNIHNLRVIYTQHLESSFPELQVYPDLTHHMQLLLSDLDFLEPSKENLEKKEYSKSLVARAIIKGMDESLKGLKALKSEVLEPNNIKSILAIKVEHCPQAYGVVIDHEGGWKLGYSGDTELCENFVEKAKGTTILIHEATFTDGLVNEAEDRSHSTVNDACRVGYRIGAWRTLLTHFSQRFSCKDLVKESKITSRESISNPSTSTNSTNSTNNSLIEDESTLLKLQHYKDNNVIYTMDHLHASFSNLKDLARISRCMNIALPEDV